MSKQAIYFKEAEEIHPLYLAQKSTEDSLLNPEVIEKMEQLTQLVYIPGDTEEGNVCMANNQEVLPDFRTSFSADDLLNYVHGIQKSQIFIDRSVASKDIHLPYPTDADFFWHHAGLGRSH